MALILSDLVALALIASAGVSYAYGDKLTAAFILTSIGSYYYGRHITNAKGK